MPISLQVMTAGDLQYIARINANNSIIQAALNALQLSTSGGGAAFSVGAFFERYFNSETTLIGLGSYKPTGSGSNLTVAAGAVYLESLQQVVGSVVSNVISFTGQPNNTYYVHIDSGGLASRSTDPVEAVYSVIWNGSAFGTITRLVKAIFDSIEEDDARTSDVLSPPVTYVSLDARLDAIETAAGSTGAVVGPGSSTNKAIARFNGITGKLIQNSTPIVQDDGRISTVTNPTSAQDAATKTYVDSAVGGGAAITQLTGEVTAGPGSGSQAATINPAGTPQVARLGIGNASDANAALKITGQYGSLKKSHGNSGASPAIDWADGNEHTWTLNAATVTFGTPTHPLDGFRYVIKIIQDGSGNRVPVFPSSFKFPGGTTPTWSTVAGKWDLVTLFWDSGDSTYTANASLNHG